MRTAAMIAGLVLALAAPAAASNNWGQLPGNGTVTITVTAAQGPSPFMVGETATGTISTDGSTITFPNGCVFTYNPELKAYEGDWLFWTFVPVLLRFDTTSLAWVAAKPGSPPQMHTVGTYQ